MRLYSDSEPPRYRLQIADTSGKGFCQILVESSSVVIENPEWVAPRPFKIDYRTLLQDRREELANELAIENTELIVQGEMMELGSVLAVLLEIEERVGLPEAAVGNGGGGRSSNN